MTAPTKRPAGAAIFAPRRGAPCQAHGPEAMHRCELDHPHTPRSHVCACGATGPVAVDEANITLEQIADLRDVIEADE